MIDEMNDHKSIIRYLIIKVLFFTTRKRLKRFGWEKRGTTINLWTKVIKKRSLLSLHTQYLNDQTQPWLLFEFFTHIITRSAPCAIDIRKWTRGLEFKSWIKQFAFQIVLIHQGKVCLKLFFLYLSKGI